MTDDRQVDETVNNAPSSRSSRSSPNSTPRRGRPRSDAVHRAILDATRDLLVESGFTHLRLEHVARRAGVGKATIYRRWPSKEALALDLLLELAAPHLAVEDVGDTRLELRACVTNASRALRHSVFGPVMRGLLTEIAENPALGDPFRASVVQARREEIAVVVRRGIARGDLRADAPVEVAAELLVGPSYFRLVFGGELSEDFADHIVDTVLHGLAPLPGQTSAARRPKRAR